MNVSRAIFLTFGARLLLYVLQFAASVVSARIFLPGLTGAGQVLQVVGSFSTMLCMAGLPAAYTIFAARDPAKRPALVGNAIAYSVVTQAALGLLLWLTRGLWTPYFGDVPAKWLMIFYLQLPAGMTMTLCASMLMGMGSVALFNVMDVAVSVVNSATTIALLLRFGDDFETVLGWQVAINIVLGAVYAGEVFALGGRSIRLDRGLLWQSLRFGAPFFLCQFLAFLVIRVNVVMVNHYSGTWETGLYGLAVRLLEVLSAMPMSAAMVIFPQLGASDDETANQQRTARVCRVVTTAVFVCGAAGCFAMPYLIPWIFGGAYAESWTAYAILFPATLIFGVENVLVMCLASKGIPKGLPSAWGVALLANAALNLWWIPRDGMLGAAAGALVSYLIVAVWVIRRFRGISGMRLRDLVWMRRDDVRLLAEGLLTRTAGKPAAPGGRTSDAGSA